MSLVPSSGSCLSLARGPGCDEADGRRAPRRSRSRKVRPYRRGRGRPRHAARRRRPAVGGELAGVELDIRLLVDHRERLVRMRTALYNDCSGICTTSGPSNPFRVAPCCRRRRRPGSVGAWPAPSRPPGSGFARDELRHLRELSHTIDALEAEIAALVAQAAPQLLAEPGSGR